MSPNADGTKPIDAVGSFARTTAQGLGSLWGMMLEHLSEKHAKAAATWSENREGGVRRTPDGILVTSKELVMQVLLNADGNYTIEGYQARMNQSIGLIYLGMDWGPEYVKQSTKSNEAIGRVTRKEAFAFAQGDARRAGCPARSRRLRHREGFRHCLCGHLQSLVGYPRWGIRAGGRLSVVEPCGAGALPGRLHPAFRLHRSSRPGFAADPYRAAHRPDPAGSGQQIRGFTARSEKPTGRRRHQGAVRGISEPRG